MRLVAAAILTTVAFAAPAQQVSRMKVPSVDLTAPGAMNALRDTDPDRYARVQKELEKVATMPCQ